jgi:hypothetical protein
MAFCSRVSLVNFYCSLGQLTHWIWPLIIVHFDHHFTIWLLTTTDQMADWPLDHHLTIEHWPHTDIWPLDTAYWPLTDHLASWSIMVNNSQVQKVMIKVVNYQWPNPEN